MIDKKLLEKYRTTETPQCVKDALRTQKSDTQAVAFLEVDENGEELLVMTVYRRKYDGPFLMMLQTATDYLIEKYYTEKIEEVKHADGTVSRRKKYPIEFVANRKIATSSLYGAFRDCDSLVHNMGYIGEDTIKAFDNASFLDPYRDDNKPCRYYYPREYNPFTKMIRCLQDDILSNRRLARNEKAWQKIKPVMDAVPALPKDFEADARKNAFEKAYAFMTNKDKKGDVTCTCSRCGHSFKIPPKKQNIHVRDKGKCPCCGTKIEYQRLNTHGNLYDDAGFTILQKVGADQLVVRMFWVSRAFQRQQFEFGKEKVAMGEIYRTVVTPDRIQKQKGYIKINAVTYASETRLREDGKLETIWTKRSSSFSLANRADSSSYCKLWPVNNNVYKRNLTRVIKASPLKYSGIELYLKEKEAMNDCFVPDMITTYQRVPSTEMMLKMNLFYVYEAAVFAKDRCKKGLCTLFDEKDVEKANRPFLPAYIKDMMLHGREINYSMFRCMKLLSDVSLYLPHEFFLEYYKFNRSINEYCWGSNMVYLLKNVTAKIPKLSSNRLIRIVKYVLKTECRYNKEYFDTRDNLPKRWYNNSFRYDWNDYLNQCIEYGLDMTNDEIVMPFNFKAEHEMISARLDVKRAMEAEQNFLSAMRDITDVLKDALKGINESSNTMIAVVPQSINELIQEGKENRNCVGDYGKKVAAGECIILFIRNKKNIDKAYCTLALDPKTGEVNQCRGYRNDEAPEEVAVFAQRIGEAFQKAKKKRAA